MAATKVELFDRIRHDSWRGRGLSVRTLARKYGVHRRLVREALAHAEPVPRKTLVRRSPQLEPLKKVVDEWLRADLDAPRKQRHTARRIHARSLMSIAQPGCRIRRCGITWPGVARRSASRGPRPGEGVRAAVSSAWAACRGGLR